MRGDCQPIEEEKRRRETEILSVWQEMYAIDEVFAFVLSSSVSVWSPICCAAALKLFRRLVCTRFGAALFAATLNVVVLVLFLKLCQKAYKIHHLETLSLVGTRNGNKK